MRFIARSPKIYAHVYVNRHLLDLVCSHVSYDNYIVLVLIYHERFIAHQTWQYILTE